MKKIMIAALAVMLGVASQAASVTWTLSAVKSSTDSTVAGSGYLAMVFDGSTAQSAVIAAIMDRDTATLGELANNWTQDTTSTSVGLLRSAGNGDYSAGDTFSAYVVIFDAGTVADADNFFISQTKEGSIAANGANSTLAFGTYAQNVSSGSSWQAIPEPTSGLLLLLGVAGLALRRKRA